MKPLLDVKGAAKALAVSTWTIRAYIRDGKLRPVRIGRLVRFEEHELERFISDAVGNPEIGGHEAILDPGEPVTKNTEEQHQ